MARVRHIMGITVGRFTMVVTPVEHTADPRGMAVDTAAALGHPGPGTGDKLSAILRH